MQGSTRSLVGVAVCCGVFLFGLWLSFHPGAIGEYVNAEGLKIAPYAAQLTALAILAMYSGGFLLIVAAIIWIWRRPEEQSKKPPHSQQSGQL
jgi:predicted membrane channel-forming protein YqfA (hemolysin III family)